MIQRLPRAAFNPRVHSLPISIRLGLFLLAILILNGCGEKDTGPLVELYHPPQVFDRRCDDFSANIGGELSERAESARFRLNGGEWRLLPQGKPRARVPQFVIELDGDEMNASTNRLEIEATPKRGEPEQTVVDFTYDPAPVQLPLTVDWTDPVLVTEDGHWERFQDESSQWRVRPVLGTEGYDRVLVVCGAFPGGRRLETDVIYHSDLGGKEWGFGPLPMWGGRPDLSDQRPKRGWLFSLAWFFRRYKGVGSEFSNRYAKEPAEFSTSYKSIQLQKDIKYRIIVDCFPEVDSAGNHLRYRQLLKWWLDGESEPADWIDLADTEGYALPVRDYGVAIVNYRCQADYGPFVLTPLPARAVEQ